MLKKRIMGVVIVRNGIAVQSIGFARYLPVGRPDIVVEYLNNWGVDEISVVDISASRKGQLNVELVRKLSSCCQVPLTYGGGIKTADDMARIVQAGADKVMINHSFIAHPELVTEGAERLGIQCIVVSLDAVRDDDGQARVYDYLARRALDETPAAAARRAQQLGAGEIFLNSVDQDGSKLGYDLNLAASVAEAVSVPVTICGGVGEAAHFAEGLAISNVCAVAAGNFFNYTEHSVTLAKQFLIQKRNAQLRHDTYFNYCDSDFTAAGKLKKKDDRTLKEMLFEFHPREII